MLLGDMLLQLVQSLLVLHKLIWLWFAANLDPATVKDATAITS